MKLKMVSREAWLKLKDIGFTHNEFAFPTQALVQMWLMEKYGIYVIVNLDCTSEPKWCYQILEYEVFEWINHLQPRTYSDLYSESDEALEAGIIEALKLIEV